MFATSSVVHDSRASRIILLDTSIVQIIMRQLKGKVKETNKQKKERKKEFVENKKKIFTIALPALGAFFLLIAVYVYFKTRPKTITEY
ncbi:hypothetical protein GE061_002754 [Apolygus lucorum]|uniref:Single-pass membrane and coiled-coil domain-containing protein 4 homolog n=1 Tax=Apolygus lucorum TaxID=248454 RepID=A0A6A4IYG8_APOLU|nr:hypothetical protein GE061_002754 [Apolygus lucorum]